MNKVIRSHPFCRPGNQGLGRWNDVSEVIQLVRGGAGELVPEQTARCFVSQGLGFPHTGCNFPELDELRWVNSNSGDVAKDWFAQQVMFVGHKAQTELPSSPCGHRNSASWPRRNKHSIQHRWTYCEQLYNDVCFSLSSCKDFRKSSGFSDLQLQCTLNKPVDR